MSEAKAESTVNLQKLLSACFDLSERSGQIIRDLFHAGSIHSVDKTLPGSAPVPVISAPTSTTSPTDDSVPVEGPGAGAATATESAAARTAALEAVDDPQTLADLQSQRLIVGSLAKAFPGLRVIGEEGSLHIDPARDVVPVRQDLLDAHPFPEHLANLPTADLTVWIDPLDGTKEYTLGIKEAVTVLAGVSFRGKPIGGVVHVPFANRTVWGAVGVGAFGLRGDKPAAERRWVATSRSHLSAPTQALIDAMGVDKVLKVGGAGSKALMVLEGQADIYFFPQPGTKRWDTCAIDAITLAAGGCFSDSYGQPIEYDPKADVENRAGVLATRSVEMHKLFTLNPEKFAIPPLR